MHCIRLGLDARLTGVWRGLQEEEKEKGQQPPSVEEGTEMEEGVSEDVPGRGVGPVVAVMQRDRLRGHRDAFDMTDDDV